MSQQAIMDAAYRAWHLSGRKVLFAAYLQAEKDSGKFWGA